MNFKSAMLGSVVAAGVLSFGVVLPSAAQTAAVSTDKGLKMYIVESCEPFAKGGRCSLALLTQPASQSAPTNAQTTCESGWVANFMGLEGTVEKGGINRGSAIVCGYQSAEQALRAAVKVCDEQMDGICSRADSINVSWASWNGQAIPGVASDQTLKVNQLPDARTCLSELPLKESADCKARAAVELRSAGIH